jgi:hypothetical protein
MALGGRQSSLWEVTSPVTTTDLDWNALPAKSMEIVNVALDYDTENRIDG